MSWIFLIPLIHIYRFWINLEDVRLKPVLILLFGVCSENYIFFLHYFAQRLTWVEVKSVISCPSQHGRYHSSPPFTRYINDNEMTADKILSCITVGAGTSSPSHWQQVEEQAPKPVGWMMCFPLMTLVPVQKLCVNIYVYIYVCTFLIRVLL